VGGFGKLGGDALYAMGKGSDIINETFGVKDREKGDSVFAKGAEALLTDAENRQNAHPHIKVTDIRVTDIKGFGDLGGWVGQTVGAVAPFAVGMAIGSTEASLASKAFLTASPGLMGFSLGAAGGAMSDMDKEMANTPGLDYSNWQYMAKTAGSVGSNALMFGNYAAIFKGNKALFESIGKTPAATVEFKKGFQDYAGDLFTVAKGSNKTGATMALVSGINMFVDNHVLGKKHEGSFEEIADSYVEGVAMHIGTAEAPKALVFMAEKLLPSPTKKAIRSNLGTIHTLMKEINNPNLTPQERTIVKNKIFEAHKENTVLLNKSLKDAGKLTGPQINELLIADQNRFDITKKVEEVKKGNFSDEYKKSELNKLKTEFKALDSRTANVFSDPFNAINILPDVAKRKTEAKTELTQEFNDKNPESNKKIVLEDKEINERALKNYSKELKDEKAAKLEVEKEQAPIVETPVAETPKAEENNFPLQEGETFIESKQDKKGNIYTTVSTVTEKDGVKTTKFSFNRSDKDAGQRNAGGADSNIVLDKFGLEINIEDVPEGATTVKIIEIREGTDGRIGATVMFKNSENGAEIEGNVRLTKKQTASPEVVAENVEGQGFSKIEEVVVTKSESTNPSFEDMIDFNVEGGTLELGKINGAKVYSVLNLKVDENRRKQGIATKLLQRALEETKGELSGQASNDMSVGLNYKLGMRAFDADGKELSLEETKKVRAEKSGTSIRMILPENKRGSNYTQSLPTQEVKTKNESTPETNTPTNGDVQPGVQPVGESGVAKPETPAKEGIPSPVDGGKAKGDVEVDNKKVVSPKKEINLEDVSSFLDQEFGSKKPVEAKEAPKQEKKTESADVAEVKQDSSPNKGDLVDCKDKRW
jgi:GNAT superfamily N-acetyltransferase